MRNLSLLFFLLTFLRFAETLPVHILLLFKISRKLSQKQSSENFGKTKRRLWKDSYSVKAAFFQFPTKSWGVVYILRIKAYSDKTWVK